MSITPKDPADFTPSMGAYKTLQPFRYWCQKVLPLVYDDSLSYYELLCKVVDYLNKTMEDVETLHEDVDGLHNAYVELQAYVNDYFSTLDVQEEINNKLDVMASDGTLDELLLPYFNEYKDEINGIVATQNDTINTQNGRITVLEARMDTFASLPDGSTSGDAELLDIRVGADGTVYSSAGDAVRGQVENLQDQIDYIEGEPSLEYIEDMTDTYASISGNRVLNVPLSSSSVKVFDISNLIGNNIKITDERMTGNYKFFYIITDGSNTVLTSHQANDLTIEDYVVNIPANATKLYINYLSAGSGCSVVINYNIPFIVNKVNAVEENAIYKFDDKLTIMNQTPNTYVYKGANGKIAIGALTGCQTNSYDVRGLDGMDVVFSLTAKSTENPVLLVTNSGDYVIQEIKSSSVSVYEDAIITLGNDVKYLYIVFDTAENFDAYFIHELNLTDAINLVRDTDNNARIRGKKCVCFGDSITWYDGHPYNWGKEQGIVAKGYESYLREAGMEVNNQGYSGATIRQIVTSKVLPFDFTGYDYVTLTSGANDSRYNIPKGTISETGVYDDSFIGELQTAIDRILTSNPEIKILLITPIRGWIYAPNGYAYPRTEDGVVEERYADAIKEVGEYYSLPVLDWYNTCGLNILTRDWYINDPEPNPSETPNPNDLYSLHPSTKGYKRMADLLLAKIRGI